MYHSLFFGAASRWGPPKSQEGGRHTFLPGATVGHCFEWAPWRNRRQMRHGPRPKCWMPLYLLCIRSASCFWLLHYCVRYCTTGTIRQCRSTGAFCCSAFYYHGGTQCLTTNFGQMGSVFTSLLRIKVQNNEEKPNTIANFFFKGT